VLLPRDLRQQRQQQERTVHGLQAGAEPGSQVRKRIRRRLFLDPSDHVVLLPELDRVLDAHLYQLHVHRAPGVGGQLQHLQVLLKQRLHLIEEGWMTMRFVFASILAGLSLLASCGASDSGSWVSSDAAGAGGSATPNCHLACSMNSTDLALTYCGTWGEFDHDSTHEDKGGVLGRYTNDDYTFWRDGKHMTCTYDYPNDQTSQPSGYHCTVGSQQLECTMTWAAPGDSKPATAHCTLDGTPCPGS
jgi:hypothetical protein